MSRLRPSRPRPSRPHLSAPQPSVTGTTLISPTDRRSSRHGPSRAGSSPLRRRALTLAAALVALGAIAAAPDPASAKKSSDGAVATAPAAVRSASVRFVHVGAPAELSDLRIDDVAVASGIPGSEASPDVTVAAGWHRLEASARSTGDVDVIFTTFAAGGTYDVVLQDTPAHAVVLIQPPTPGPLHVADLRRHDTTTLQIAGVGPAFSLHPGNVVARSRARGDDEIVVSNAGRELTRATFRVQAGPRRDLVVLTERPDGSLALSTFSEAAAVTAAASPPARRSTPAGSGHAVVTIAVAVLLFGLAALVIGRRSKLSRRRAFVQSGARSRLVPRG